MENESSACAHLQPGELAELAENHLREKAVPPEEWEDCRFGFVQNLGSGRFKSVYLEIVRRPGTWTVAKIDRRTESAPTSEEGFIVRHLSAAAQKRLQA